MAAYPQQRNELDRRSGHDRRNLSLSESECLRCCRLAGAVFVGIQEGHGNIGDMCLFQAAPVATTLCLPVADLTPMAILIRLQTSRKKYIKAFGQWYPNRTEEKKAARA
jgi:hypothetical protein